MVNASIFYCCFTWSKHQLRFKQSKPSMVKCVRHKGKYISYLICLKMINIRTTYWQEHAKHVMLAKYELCSQQFSQSDPKDLWTKQEYKRRNTSPFTPVWMYSVRSSSNKHWYHLRISVYRLTTRSLICLNYFHRNVKRCCRSPASYYCGSGKAAN